MVRAESVVVRDKIRADQPTILLLVGAEPLEPLLAFFREKVISLSAERAYAQAVGRFVEWLSVHAGEFTEPDRRGFLYTAFVHDLRFGTFRDGRDDSGLNWTPVSDANLRRLSRCLLEFSDWLSLRFGATMLNPIHNQATFTDQLIFWRRWDRRKAGSFLAHAKSRSRAETEASQGRRMRLPGRRIGNLPEAKAFPVEYIDALLWRGFARKEHHGDARPWMRFHLRDILVTLLCLYGGCRESEPMHLWVDDVFVDPDDSELALVLIHDPEDGVADYTDPLTGARRKTSRADFLQRHCGGRVPLNRETGRRHAGWKGALLTHRERRAFQVFWIDREAGRLFLTLWRMYLLHARPLALQTPWAFLTKDGQPLGVEAFSDAFAAAIRRIGLSPAKWAGTTTHGLRHRYGQWLNDLGVGDKEGQVALHHLNAKSQEIYRQVGVAQVAAVVRTANVTSLPPPINELSR